MDKAIKCSCCCSSSGAVHVHFCGWYSLENKSLSVRVLANTLLYFFPGKQMHNAFRRPWCWCRFPYCKWSFFHQLYKLETFLFVVILPAVKRGNDGHFNCASWELSWPLQHLQWRWWHTNAPPSNMCASIDERERISRRALGDDRTSSLRLLQNYRWCLPFPSNSSQPPPPPSRLVPRIVVWAPSRESASYLPLHSQSLFSLSLFKTCKLTTPFCIWKHQSYSYITHSHYTRIPFQLSFSTRSSVSDNFFFLYNKISSSFFFVCFLLFFSFKNSNDVCVPLSTWLFLSLRRRGIECDIRTIGWFPGKGNV